MFSQCHDVGYVSQEN